MKRILFRAAVVLAAALLLALLLSWFFIDWDEVPGREYPGGVVLRDSRGDILRVALGKGYVDCRPWYEADENDWAVKALVAVEDGEFWNHCGVRPLSVLRAFFQNVVSKRRISGASTITMQAVRLISPHKKSYWRKWVEAIQALKMERRHSKKWILSQYMNRAPYGSNLIGIEAAASGWFSKSVRELGLGEAAMLAAMVQAPSRYRPDRGYAAAIKRRDYVLERMLKLGYITEEQMQGARGVMPEVHRSHRPFKAPYYCDWFMKEFVQDAGAVLSSGRDIATPLDPDVQKLCESIVAAAGEKNGFSSAAVVMRNGEVVALACSGDYFDKSSGQVNTAMAMRPAGSTLKPLLVALALDAGIATPEEVFNDAPLVYKGYRPANFDAKYRGKVSLRDALVLSLNIPFVQLLERTGLTRFGDALRALGFSSLRTGNDAFGLGMAIGNVETSLVELVRAYSRLARGEAFSPAAAYLVSDMLSGEERLGVAVGHLADVRLPRFAWKTGTSSAFRDAWTIAWNPEYVIGVWCGHKRGGFGDERLVGAKAAAPLAWQIARELYPGKASPWFDIPADVCARTVCAHTGLPKGPACRETAEGRYIQGRSFAIPCAECAKPDRDAQLKLSFVKPEPDAEFSFVEGMPQQQVVCEVSGNTGNAPLWWFVNGEFARRTQDTARFAVDMIHGTNTVTCATADGMAASVTFSVAPQRARTPGQ